MLGDAQKVEFKMMRKPQRLPAIAEGTVDVGISMLRVSAESAQKVDFSTPYFSSGLAVLQTAEGTIQSMGDLAGKTLAVIERNDRQWQSIEIRAPSDVENRIRARTTDRLGPLAEQPLGERFNAVRSID